MVTLSDSSGMIYDPDGIDEKKLAYVMELKNIKRGRIKEYADKYGVNYESGKRPWHIACDIALPSATQNEINKNDAKRIIVFIFYHLVFSDILMFPCFVSPQGRNQD